MRYDRPRRLRPVGERAGELAAGADAELWPATLGRPAADQARAQAAAAGGGVDLVRRLATASGRQIQYAAVALGVDDQWRGRRISQVEIVVDTVGIYVRGFAVGATFSEALDELDRRLERRLGYARDRVRSHAGLRPGPSVLAGPPTSRSTGPHIGR